MGNVMPHRILGRDRLSCGTVEIASERARVSGKVDRLA
jgi:hypothetical protein